MGLMKKVLVVLLCVFSIFMLMGCESSSNDRTKLFSAMEKQQIISKGYNKIDMVSVCYLKVEICKCDKYYIYKDNNSNMIAVKYEKNISRYNDYDHAITIYNNVSENSDFKYISKDSSDADCFVHTYYKYENGDLTDNNKYNFISDNKKTYYVTIKKSFFSTKYKFSEN